MGSDPAKLLPRTPDSITTFTVEWSWDTFDERSFHRLLGNYGWWSELNSGADSPNTSLWSLLELHRKQFGKIFIRGLSTVGAAAERQIDDYLTELGDGIAAPHERKTAMMSWLGFALNPFPELFGMLESGVSTKANIKDQALNGENRIAIWHDDRDC